MIRKTWNTDKWLLTMQTEHARLSAVFAASWHFPNEKPCDEVFKAILCHDDGWKEADATPAVKSDGDPLGFDEIRLVDAVPIYTRSIDLRQEAGHLYGASLVAGHFLYLVDKADLARASTADAKAAGLFMAQTASRLKQFKLSIQQNDAGVAALKKYETDLRFLQVCDYLSLMLCTDFSGDETIENVPYLRKGNTLKVTRPGTGLALGIDPLPFKKNLRDHLTSCTVPFIPYDSPEELQMAMDEMKTVSNEVHLGAPN